MTSSGLSILGPREKPSLLSSPPQPAFNYAGGKYRLRETIINKMSPHEAYVEPFAGAANVILAKPPAQKEVLNDKAAPIAKVHATIKARAGIWKMSPSEKRWDEIKKKSPSKRTAEEQAYLIGHSYGGKGLVYNNHGKSVPFDTKPLHKRLKDVKVESKDFSSVMKQNDSKNTLFYLDPPYPKHSEHYMVNDATPERVAEVSDQMKGKVMVSYEDSSKVKKAFSGKKWKIHTIRVPRGIQGGTVMSKELLITNFDPSKERKHAVPYDEDKPGTIMHGIESGLKKTLLNGKN